MPARPDQLAQPEAAVQTVGRSVSAARTSGDATRCAPVCGTAIPGAGAAGVSGSAGAQAPGQYAQYAPPAYGQTGPLPVYGQTGPLPVQTGPAPYGQPPYGQPMQPGQPGEAKSGPNTAPRPSSAAHRGAGRRRPLWLSRRSSLRAGHPRHCRSRARRTGSKQILTNNYQVEKLSNVSCPSGERVRRGTPSTAPSPSGSAAEGHADLHRQQRAASRSVRRTDHRSRRWPGQRRAEPLQG